MIAIVQEPIDVNALLRSVQDEAVGAIVLFLGTVRNNDDDGAVSELYLESYVEMAQEALKKIDQEATQRWNLKKFAAVHRVGNLKVGEIIVAIAVASGHRKEAFEACRFAIDKLKKTAPIWKKEISGSSARWVEGVMLEDNQDGNV